MKTYIGKLSLDYEWDTIRINDDNLLEEIEEDFNNNYASSVKISSLRYVVSDKPINDIEVSFADIITMTQCDLEIVYTVLCGSEWTGVYGVDEVLKVGKHNLYDELWEYANKGLYLYLEIKGDM